MSRLTDLIREAKKLDSTLGDALDAEVRHLTERRAFGLNFERHAPEVVDLVGRPVCKGGKVRMLPPRGETQAPDTRLWRATGARETPQGRVVELHDLRSDATAEHPIGDLMPVAESTDVIYPGLVSTGRIERGGATPFHTVINSENLHALKALLYTHRGKVDCIYIDPPYNTGAQDWKYNNDYVDTEDAYRHSKWLTFMERRLVIAGELLNPAHSTLLVTIDEKEYLRLGLLLEQLFPSARIQMVSTAINPKGSARAGAFRRNDEYIFVALFGDAAPARLPLPPEWATGASGDATESEGPGWTSMMRRGSAARREDRGDMFYPIYVDEATLTISEVGSPLPAGVDFAPPREGLLPVLPHRKDGSQGRWQVSPAELLRRIEQGRIRLGRKTAYGYVINYLPDGAYREVCSPDKFEITGRASDGSILAERKGLEERVAATQWKIPWHNASEHGTALVSRFLPGRSFPFPKSLYAVEDALRFFLSENPSAVVLDFFAGSGTTAHAVMRLNQEDGGQRQSISVTNNDVSSSEAVALRSQGLRPGDAEWELNGICELITKPRIAATVRGKTPEGHDVKGNYAAGRCNPCADGLPANVEFFDLTYEAPLKVSAHHDFERIAPLLWLRAGATGRRIVALPNGWDVADTYGVIDRLQHTAQFAAALAAVPDARVAFVVTDDERRFQTVVSQLPAGVEPVRLYESYLRNFEIDAPRSAR